MVEKAAANSGPFQKPAAAGDEPRVDPIKAPSPGIVDVWVTPLTTSTARLEALQKILSLKELDRASRFRFDEHRTRYIVAHGCLRQLLSGYASVPAKSIEFELGTNG